jgi:hypothetical protein
MRKWDRHHHRLTFICPSHCTFCNEDPNMKNRQYSRWLALSNGSASAPSNLSKIRQTFLTFVLLLAFCVTTLAGNIDYSSHDVPLYEQITNRIKDKVLARLGEGRNTRDRYFIIPFAYQNRGNDPAFSHSFITVIRVFPDGSRPRVTPGLQARKYHHREFEAFTISWLPHDFVENPNLCVFDGFGARLFPKANRCPISVGKDFNLETTIKLGSKVKNAVGMWGPYEVTKGGFDLGVNRMRLLDQGTIKYRADDRLYRMDRVAINCFHAIAGLDELFPRGGIFGTGFKMWGLNGTRRVLIEYTTKASNKGLLLEPVDVRRDLYGFVYAPNQSRRGVYNPFSNASAYRR